VERLLKAYPTAIAGMKDSSGDWNNTKTLLDAFAETASAARTFDVFVGSESFLLANIRNGGAGTISATANVNAAAIYQLYARWNTTDDPDYSDRQQSKLNPLRDVFARTSWPSMIAALKQAIAIYRNDPEWTRVRPPLVELTTEQAKLLADQLRTIEFALMRAETPEQFGTIARWIHVPAWVIVASLVAFVRLYLQAGRPWLAWTVIGLRTVSLILNFVFSPNLNYWQIGPLRHISFL